MNLPVLQALVLADHVYDDRQTRKKVIAGTFNQLWSKQFPDRFSRTTFAFISLTDVRGEQKLMLRYVDLADNAVLMETHFAVRSGDPLESVEIVIEIPPFPMPHPGAYAFEVLAGSEPLGSLRMTVRPFQEPK